MDAISEWAPTIVAIAAFAGLLWRFETRISGVETRLGERISSLSERVSRIEGSLGGFATKADIARIEGLLEGYFMRSGKKDAE